jgi:hypothetical protein
MVGAIYCKKPIIDMAILLAPCAKNRRGTAVIAPAPIKAKRNEMTCQNDSFSFSMSIPNKTLIKGLI